MVSEFSVDEFAFGTKTPEGVDSFVSEEHFTWKPKISNNEAQRIRDALDMDPAADIEQILTLYWIQ